MINLQATLDANHQEYHFNDSEVDFRCCGWCWHSKPKHPKEYTIDDRYRLQPQYKRVDYNRRIQANQRLADILRHNLDHDPVACNKAFEKLQERINHNIYNGSSITSDKLAMIINIIHETKVETHGSSKPKPRQTHSPQKGVPSMRRNGKKKARKSRRDPESYARLP